MAPIADRRVLESQVLYQEIVRLDALTKQRIEALRTVSGSAKHDERWILVESKEIKRHMDQLLTKLESLAAIVPRLASRADQTSMQLNVDRHFKELEENKRQLRIATIAAKKRIGDQARSSLLKSSLTPGERRLQKQQKDQASLEETQAKTTQKLTELLARMSDSVSVSEKHIETLVHSSAQLAHTQSEYDLTAQHIQTGSRLLSKYERRENSDKILIGLAFLFYLCVIYYILQKRVLSKFWIF